MKDQGNFFLFVTFKIYNFLVDNKKRQTKVILINVILIKNYNFYFKKLLPGKITYANINLFYLILKN